MTSETSKALAAIFAAGAIFVGGVVAVSNWISHQPQTLNINVHFDAPK